MTRTPRAVVAEGMQTARVAPMQSRSKNRPPGRDSDKTPREPALRISGHGKATDRVFAGFAQARDDIIVRVELHGDSALVVQLTQPTVDVRVIDFAGSRLTPAGHIGYMDQTDLRDIGAQLLDQIPVLSLPMVPKVQQRLLSG